MQVEGVVSSDLRARPEAVVALQVLGAGEHIFSAVCAGESLLSRTTFRQGGPTRGRRAQVACSLS